MKIEPTNITEVQKEQIFKLTRDIDQRQLGKLVSGLINIKKYKNLKSISELSFRDARKLINELHRTPDGAYKSL